MWQPLTGVRDTFWLQYFRPLKLSNLDKGTHHSRSLLNTNSVRGSHLVDRRVTETEDAMERARVGASKKERRLEEIVRDLTFCQRQVCLLAREKCYINILFHPLK